MHKLIPFILLFAPYIVAISGETNCDSFSYGSLCSLYPTDNLIGVFQSLITEIECQDHCHQTTNCHFFTFQKFTNGGSSCFLFKSCNNTLSCSSLDECTMGVSGPPSPSISDTCCSEFEHKACPIDYLIDEILDVPGEEECQVLCRDVKGCSYWSLVANICFLYLHCDDAQPCTSCTSGPAFPDISTCNSQRVLHTLVMGGQTSSEIYSKSVELITSNVVCTPDMPPLPVGRDMAASILLGSKIYYCGGIDDTAILNIHGTCHSYLLGQGSNAWVEEPSMVFGRYDFGLTAIGNTMYATGGYGKFGTTTYTSVESYTLGGKWELREDMAMPRNRFEHCSVALRSRLVVIGGNTIPYVEAFDTDNPEAGWVLLANMNRNTLRHACLVGELEGQAGVFVSGYWDVGNVVEFYFEAANKWLTLEALSSGRSWHTMTFLNGQMIVAGGYSLKTTVETLNGTKWIATNNLKVGRQQHVAVSIPAGLLMCADQD